MDTSGAKRLKQLEDENEKLKKLQAEQILDAAALRSAMRCSASLAIDARARNMRRALAIEKVPANSRGHVSVQISTFAWTLVSKAWLPTRLCGTAL